MCTISENHVFLLLTLCCTSGFTKHIYHQQVQSNHNANQNYKEASFSESELISEILQQDNEILDEMSEIEAGEEVNGSLKNRSHRKVPLMVPAYLKLIDENLPVILTSLGTRTGPIARAWLPVEIRRNETEGHRLTTEVIFQQTTDRRTLGDFKKAEVILTLKSDAEFSNDGGTYVQISFNDGTWERKILSKNTTFYAFNATSILQRSLADNLEHPKQIGISFQVSESDNEFNNMLFLEDIFDVQVERPFILYMYQELPENIFAKIHETGRQKRSILVAPSQSDLEDSTSQPLSIPTQQSQPQLPSNTNETDTLQEPATLKEKETVTGSSILQVLKANKIKPHQPSVPAMNPPSSNCRKVDWNVDTDEIGWFEAVSPKRLDLGFCTGSCPFPLQNDHYNFTLHSFFVDKHRMLKVFDVPRNFPRSCCVPISYKPIRVFLMEEDNTLVHVEYQDVLVDTCGCR